MNLAINPGERHAIIGPNGAGKSTLLHLVSGRIKPDNGVIRLHGTTISGLPPHKICCAGVARSFQVTNLFDRMSVIENLLCAAMCVTGYRYVWWRSMTKMKSVQERALHVLNQIDLAKKRDHPAGELAYAEQRALELGVAIIGDPAVLLLDEPTAGMSRSETAKMVDLIRHVTAPPRALIIIEHDMSVVFSLADRISVLVYGEVIATGHPKDIQNDSAVQQAYLGSNAE